MKMKETFNSSEKPNDRGISVLFGWAVLESFLETNRLRAVVRAHEQKDDGFKLHMWRGEQDDPPCITIFSAPNYCQHRNPGAILYTNNQGDKARIYTYNQFQHNYFLRLQPEEDPGFETDRPRYADDPSVVFISYHNYIKWWISDIFQHLLCEIAELAEKESVASQRPENIIEVIPEEDEEG